MQIDRNLLKSIALILLLGFKSISAQEMRPAFSQFYDISAYCHFTDSTEKKINTFFQKHYKSGIFNGTYLFHKNDSLVQGALGYANFTRRDTLMNDDIFQLASVSKTITGIAIMMLQQDGLLNINDSVHWYIPDLKRRNLTIKNLLTHTSGLPDYFYFGGDGGYGHMINHDVVTQLNRLGPASFAAPSRVHSYSNTNFVLLAYILEKVTCMDFRTYVRKYIFEISGMKYSHINNFDSIPLANYTVSGCENRQYIGDNVYNGTTGDKGVYANCIEMLFLDRILRTSYLLHERAKEELWTPYYNAGSEGVFYGLGWRVKWINGKKWVFHNGFWKGFRTYYWRCLDEDICFVVLTNNVYGPFLKTAEMVQLIDPQ